MVAPVPPAWRESASVAQDGQAEAIRSPPRPSCARRGVGTDGGREDEAEAAPAGRRPRAFSPLGGCDAWHGQPMGRLRRRAHVGRDGRAGRISSGRGGGTDEPSGIPGGHGRCLPRVSRPPGAPPASCPASPCERGCPRPLTSPVLSARSQRPFSAASVPANGRGRTTVPSDPEDRALELTQRAEEDVRVHNHALPSAWLTGHGCIGRAAPAAQADISISISRPARPSEPGRRRPAPIPVRIGPISRDLAPSVPFLAAFDRPPPAGHRPRPDPARARARPCVRACGRRPRK